MGEVYIMFDIKIGTIIPVRKAAKMISQLEPKGFECFELDFFGENLGEMCILRLKTFVK